MKYFKQVIFASMIVVGFIGISFKYGHADSAPSTPDCAGGFDVSDGKGNYTPTPITCGYLNLKVRIDLSKYKDTFVLLDKEEVFGSETKYSIVTNGIANIATPYKITHEFIAVDKGYFDSHGGLMGIFSTTTHTDSEFGNYTAMDPKNPTEFSSHEHGFILQWNDPLAKGLEPAFMNGDVVFPNSVNAYEETTHLECNDTNPCTKDVTYVLESFFGTSLNMTIGKVVYTPDNVGQSITYPIYNQQVSVTSNQDQAPVQPVVQISQNQTPTESATQVLPQHISFWRHFWNWVKSIF